LALRQQLLTLRDIGDKQGNRALQNSSIAERRGRVDLPAVCFNQYNVRGVAITFPFL
jgi:hypothetical protein